MPAAPRPPMQRDPALGVHRAALARLTPPLSLLDRDRPAVVRGHGAGAWVAALPTAGVTGTRLPGPLMRAAVRLWLGVPPVATHTGRGRRGAPRLRQPTRRQTGLSTFHLSSS